MKSQNYGHQSKSKKTQYLGSLFIMKNRILILTILLVSTIVIIPQSKKDLTLNDIYNSSKFTTKLLNNVQWLPDGSAFTYTKDDPSGNFKDIFQQDVKTGKEKLILKGSEFKYKGRIIRMSHYSWTKDGKFLLIEGPETTIWRHSRQAPYYLFNVSTKTVAALANNNPHLRNVKLSPNGKLVGFVKDHNIYVVDLQSGKETQLTTDGSENILNGEFDWAYEEEFSMADAWRWSPDGTKIAFWRMDQTRVKIFHLVDEMTTYNSVFNLKYPKAGEQNSIVKIGVIELNSLKTKWMNTGRNDDIYIPRIYWTNTSSKLAILRLNRLQNKMEMLMANTNNGKSMVIIKDTDPKWVDVTDNIKFLKNSDQIIWTSEKSGFRHAYLYNYYGNFLKQITGGRWEISQIIGVDEANNWVYFTGKKDSPIEQNIYRTKLDGTNLERISKNDGWHIPNFSPKYNAYIDEYSSVTTPTKTILNKADGSVIKVLAEDNIPALKDYNFTYPKFVTVKTQDGTELNAYMIKPTNFDPNQKYPVLVYGYGGPGSQLVVDKWGGKRTLWHQFIAEHGYIVFCLDNRGTGGRGKAFKNLVYGDLGKWAVHDQIQGAKYLASLPYVDSNRLGFWGWSGGGYLTLMMMTKAAGYFKVGVSVAPVSDFHLYDAIWTERYMNLPKNNPMGYRSASVMTYANKLKGHLLMIHGTTDDNVHFQNTLQLVNKFEEDLKQFDLMVYPNRNHSISGGNTQIHLFTKISNYFFNNL